MTREGRLVMIFFRPHGSSRVGSGMEFIETLTGRDGPGTNLTRPARFVLTREQSWDFRADFLDNEESN